MILHSDGSDIAEVMLKGIPGPLRVRMAMDVLGSVITPEQCDEIESILSTYLDEALIIERDFDWEALD